MFKKIMVVVLIVVAFVGVSYIEHNYTKQYCEVIDKNDGYIEFVDSLNGTWVWNAETEEEIKLYRTLEIGDRIDVKMFDNLTSANIEDDIIKKIIIVE